MNWDDIWIKKGNENTSDLKSLNGFDVLNCNINFTPEDTVNNIIKYCDIDTSNKVLEIGAGAGRLGKIFLDKNYDYYAVERSESLVNKFKLLIDKNKIEINKTNKLSFEDNSFDIVFCWSITQYFKSIEDVDFLLSEMMRVSKKCILIGDIYEFEDNIKKNYKYKSTNLQHLCIPKKKFEDMFKSSNEYNYKLCNFTNTTDVRYNCLINKKL